MVTRQKLFHELVIIINILLAQSLSQDWTYSLTSKKLIITFASTALVLETHDQAAKHGQLSNFKWCLILFSVVDNVFLHN